MDQHREEHDYDGEEDELAELLGDGAEKPSNSGECFICRFHSCGSKLLA